MKFFRFSDFQVLFGLFCTTQDTIFFIFVVDALAEIAALRSEIEVAMEVENEHLAEVAHLRVLRVRRKGREIFGLDTIALNREGVHQHRAETPFVGIVTKTDMMVELAVLQRFAPQVIAAVVTSPKNCQPLYMPMKLARTPGLKCLCVYELPSET